MNYTGYLFVVVKVCVEPATLFGWANNRRMAHHWVISFSEQHSRGFEIRVTLSGLNYLPIDGWKKNWWFS